MLYPNVAVPDAEVQGIPSIRVLASASLEGHDVEVIEYADGGVAIRWDGSVPSVYRWGVGELDACMNLYLRLFRR